MILLDTHVWLWLVTSPEKLSRRAASAIRRARASDGIAVSDISLWEMASLSARGILRTYGSLEQTVRELVINSRVNVRMITPEIAALAQQFPLDFPRDPADRIIGATARAERLLLITRDNKMLGCDLLRTLW